MTMNPPVEVLQGLWQRNGQLPRNQLQQPGQAGVDYTMVLEPPSDAAATATGGNGPS